MQRFSTWEQKQSPDFWRDKFRPKDFLRVTAHINSVVSMRHDARLMERFDINDIDSHSVGSTYVWIPVTFGEPTYLGDEELYPWQYDIDENWLWVDAIYDKHVDPEYEIQNKIDFILKKGKIAFVHKLPEIPLYISKGRYAGYRIYNEIGALLDYKRKDSVRYRDTIAPILASFYLGPTPRNLVALLNVIAGIPVAKFGDETVVSIKDNKVETDKYTYPMGNVPISVSEGDILYRFQPLSDAVELITHKTHPQWWEDRPVDLFAKYRVDGPMNDNLRNYLMEYFLKDVVAYVRFKLDYQDLQNFEENRDLINVLMEALPTRTDIFMGQQYKAESWDTNGEIMVPNFDAQQLKLGVAAIRTLTKIDSEMYSYAPDIGRPIFTNNVTHKQALTLNDGSWHILSPTNTNNWQEFWKPEPNKASLFEPTLSMVYLRLSETAPWEHSELRVESYGFPIDLSDLGVKINLYGDKGSGVFSELPFDLEDTKPVFQAIPGEVVCGLNEMDDWEFDNVIYAKDGVVVYDGEKGVITTSAFFTGNIPKNAFVRTEYDTPENTLVDIKYSTDKETWLEIPKVITNVTGNLYFKISLYASVQKSPTFRRLYLNLTAIE